MRKVVVVTLVLLALLSGCGVDEAQPSTHQQAPPSSGQGQADISSSPASVGSPKKPLLSEPKAIDVNKPGTVPWSPRQDYQTWPPALQDYLVEPPSRWDELRARFLLPQSVQAGETVNYVVVLSNISNDTVDLRPCGGYRQEVSVVGAALTAQPIAGGESKFRLNCDSTATLSPAESHRFAMRLTIPPAATGSEILFTWGFIDNLPDYEAQEWICLRASRAEPIECPYG